MTTTNLKETTMNYPKYVSHKTVEALKIKSVEFEFPKMDGHPGMGRTTITPEDPAYPPFEVAAGYADKHQPKPGGYYVRYQDGYESFSPDFAFESGYTRV